MFKLFIVGTVCALSAMVSGKSHPINAKIFDEIKAKAQGWEAHTPENNPLRHMTREELLNLVGTNVDFEHSAVPTDKATYNTTPASFDPRTDKFSKCIHPIRDQQQCGSCWAFGATEALSDRFCINGKDLILAPQDPVSCDSNNYGCDGGYLNYVWQYFTNTGVVTEACWPYTSGGGDSGWRLRLRAALPVSHDVHGREQVRRHAAAQSRQDPDQGRCRDRGTAADRQRLGQPVPRARPGAALTRERRSGGHLVVVPASRIRATS